MYVHFPKLLHNRRNINELRSLYASCWFFNFLKISPPRLVPLSVFPKPTVKVCTF